MLELHVDKMTCGHCVRAVTEAVQEIDPAARVEIDLPRKTVKVQSSLDAAAIAAAIAAAGYPLIA